MDSNPINEIATALAKAQGEMEHAEMNGYNPHFKNRFATLTDCWNAIRGPFSRNGLSVTQPLVVIDGSLYLRTTINHSSGQSLSSDFPLPASQNIQGMGSVISYSRRYSLKAMVGVADSEGEDDGEEASRNGNKGNSGNAVNKTGPNRGTPTADNNGPGKPSPTGDVQGVRGPGAQKQNTKVVLRESKEEGLTEKQTSSLLEAFKKKGLHQEGAALLLKQFNATSVFGLTKEQGQKLWAELEAMPDRTPSFKPKPATTDQITRLWTIAAQAGWEKDHVHDYIGKEFGIESTKELDQHEYNLLCAEMMK